MAFDPEAERARLRGLGSVELGREVTAGGMVRRERGERVELAMTLAEAAKIVSPAYRDLSDRLDALRKQDTDLDREIEREQNQAEWARERRDAIWQGMGMVRRALHLTHIRPDRDILDSDLSHDATRDRWEHLNAQKAALQRELGTAEQNAAKALELARSEAQREVAERQQRAALAWEVWREREAERRRAREHERQHQRERDGFDLGR